MKPHPSDIAIGNAIASFRVEHCINADQICDGLGLDATELERVESGRQPLLARDLLWILDTIGAPLSLQAHLHLKNGAGR